MTTLAKQLARAEDRMAAAEEPDKAVVPELDRPLGFVVVLPLMSANKLWKPIVSYRGSGFMNTAYATLVDTPKYEAWKKQAGEALVWDFSEDPPKRLNLEPVLGRVAVSMVLVPDRTNRDTDNIIKAVLDLLVSHGLIEGDTVKTVKRLDVEVWEAKQEAIPKGHVQVRVRGLPAGT